MTWALQSFLGTFVDATVGQFVHALDTSRPPSWQSSPLDPAAEPPWEPPLWRPAPHGTVPDPGDLQDDSVKLVRYAIVSLRRCEERILPGGCDEVLVRGPMTADGFAAWIVAQYLQPGGERDRRNRIPRDEKRYLRVYHRVLTRWPPGSPGQGRRIAPLEGIRDAIRGLPRPDHPAPPAPAVIAWDGTGTPSQVGARGSVTLARTWNGDGYDVTLEGRLAIHSQSYGYVRHGLPLGYLPVSADPRAYPCAVQRHATLGDLSGVDNYGGMGVHVRRDSFPGYEGRATLWFPERDYNGEIALLCTWQTKEPPP